MSGQAERELRRLDRVVSKRIVRSIDELSGNPDSKSNVKRLTGSRLWRLRVGDYRVVFERDEMAKVLRIATLGHRKEVYT